jgi:FtsZ-binding cell division protein ZapB
METPQAFNVIEKLNEEYEELYQENEKLKKENEKLSKNQKLLSSMSEQLKFYKECMEKLGDNIQTPWGMNEGIVISTYTTREFVEMYCQPVANDMEAFSEDLNGDIEDIDFNDEEYFGNLVETYNDIILGGDVRETCGEYHVELMERQDRDNDEVIWVCRLDIDTTF